MPIRLAIRGYANGLRRFEDLVTVDGDALDQVLPALAGKHATELASEALHMIEIEFLDEPNPNERFFRIGTDPSQMVLPLRVRL